MIKSLQKMPVLHDHRLSLMKKPLPTINGVGPSCMRIMHNSGRTVLECLTRRFPGIAAEAWISRMKNGKVVDENGRGLEPDTLCRPGGYIYYYRELDKETPIPFEESLLYRDDHILVADKPHFLPVIPSGRYLQETLLVRLKQKLVLDHLVPLHRIDRETAGLVIFSHDPGTRGRYASLFRDRKVRKIYEAMAPYAPGIVFPLEVSSRITKGKPFFRMVEEDGVPNATTRISIIETVKDTTRYRLEPLTGRKHQLRLHMAALGIPILNDRIYPVTMPPAEDDFSRPLKLLARSVTFPDPFTGQTMHFESRTRLA
jgi:tRNA pseudouridine32 synthase/23S rRNA pseudouridine746 synthase